MVSSVLVGLAGAVSLLFGIRYLFAKQFMPYIGGGLAAYGLALLWLLIPLGARQPWAAWAVLSLSALVVLPTLHVTLALRRAAPAARTPVAPALIVLILVLAGAGLSFSS